MLTCQQEMTETMRTHQLKLKEKLKNLEERIIQQDLQMKEFLKDVKRGLEDIKSIKQSQIKVKSSVQNIQTNLEQRNMAINTLNNKLANFNEEWKQGRPKKQQLDNLEKPSTTIMTHKVLDEAPSHSISSHPSKSPPTNPSNLLTSNMIQPSSSRPTTLPNKNFTIVPLDHKPTQHTSNSPTLSVKNTPILYLSDINNNTHDQQHTEESKFSHPNYDVQWKPLYNYLGFVKVLLRMVHAFRTD